MKTWFRSTKDSKLAGVCGGIAARLGIDSTIVRVIAVIAAFFSFGAMLLLYVAAALIMPKAPYDDYSFGNDYRY